MKSRERLNCWRKVLALFLGAVIVGTVGPGCGKGGNSPDAVVADVGGRPVKLRQVTDYITALHVNFRSTAEELDARRKYLNRLVEDQLLVTAGYTRGLDADIGIVSAVDAEKDKFLLDELYRKEVIEKSAVTEDEVKDLYSHWFDRVRLRHILVADSARADSLLAQVKAGKDFGDLAEKFSLDEGSRFRNGEVGRDVSYIDLPPALAKVVFSLAAGATGGPVDIGGAWDIVEVISKHKLEERSLDEARPTIMAVLTRQKQQERRLAQLTDLRRRANLRYDPDVLALWRSHLKAIADTAGLPSGQRPAVVSDSLPAVEKDRVIYRFGEDGTVTLYQFCKSLESRAPYERPNPDDSAQVNQYAFVNSLFDILHEEALGQKLDESPIYKDRVKEYLEKLMADRMRTISLRQGVSVTPMEAHAYFDAHPDSFMAPIECHVREVMVNDRKLAEQIMQQARAGTPLENLARQYTMRTELRSKGGDLGWLDPSTYPDLYKAALRLKPGELAGPLAAVDQYSIIQLIETRAPQPQTFDEVQNSIFNQLQKRRQDSVFTAFVDSMKVTHPVKIYDDVLATGLTDAKGRVDSVGAR